MSPLSVLLALCIGAALGLIGGGGSILTVPALVFAAGLEPRAAIAASLLVVGVTSLVGMLAHVRLGSFDARAAVWFGGLGMVGATLGSLLGQQLPERVLLLIFAGVALLAGVAMLKGPRIAHDSSERRPAAVVIAAALGVGFLTGLVGVGGGFLIVPALVLVLRLPMARAVGTSLAVIAANCLAGLTTSLGALGAQHALVITVFATFAIAGSLLGTRLSRRVSPAALRQGFAVVVLGVAVFTGLQAAA